MDTATYQLIGRRLDRPQTVLFRDRAGRHFLRSSCGGRLVRLTNQDATALLRHHRYHSVLDGDWRSLQEAIGLDCTILPEAYVDAHAHG